MDLAIKLIVLLPLLAAAIAGLFCRIIGDRPAQIVTCAALLIAAALSIFVFVRIGFGPENAKLVVVKLFTWMDSGTLNVDWCTFTNFTRGVNEGRQPPARWIA